jgi:hypothetical protein
MWLYPVPIGIGPGRGGGACNRELRRILLPRSLCMNPALEPSMGVRSKPLTQEAVVLPEREQVYRLVLASVARPELRHHQLAVEAARALAKPLPEPLGLTFS